MQVGDHLRHWRQRRRLSQMDVALAAGLSTRHLSFIETGRSNPSRQMILNLAEHFRIPIRERNVLLVSAGFAPVFAERPLEHPALAAVRAALDIVVEGHKPYPAFALDRHWNLVASNRALPLLYEGIAPHLLEAPINALRLSLHPQGMSPRIENLGEWHAHALRQLQYQVDISADPVLIALHREIQSYPAPAPDPGQHYDVFVPYRVRTSAS
jgi:transcriptional regulator with XRE-family HTH domain